MVLVPERDAQRATHYVVDCVRAENTRLYVVRLGSPQYMQPNRARAQRSYSAFSLSHPQPPLSC